MKEKLLQRQARGFDRLAFYFPNLRAGTKVAGQLIDKATFVKALGLLNDKLAEAKTDVTFLCVGGGTMVLALGSRGGTEDLDGLLKPEDAQTDAIFEVSSYEVAEELGLDPRWINTHVQHIMRDHGYQPQFFEDVPEYQWSHLKMRFAKPGFVLSLKCRSLRTGKNDFNDIVTLLRLLQITTLDGLQTEVTKYSNKPFQPKQKDMGRLMLAIAWAFPGKTEYDDIRVHALEAARKLKS